MAFETVDIDLTIPGAPPVSPAERSATEADREAQRNFAANQQALAGTQPQLAARLADARPVGGWIYARDGALTALDQNGAWWSGCSLPHRAASAMLKKLQVRGASACFVAPHHAAQIQVALEKLDLRQAIIAIMPELNEVVTAMHCVDFSSAIQAHRLWIAAGTEWMDELSALFKNTPGLSEPEQLVRAPAAGEDRSEQIILSVHRVLNAESQRRKALLAELKQRGPGPAQRVCVVAPSRFRLWNDAGRILAQTLASDRPSWQRLDPDDPIGTSSLGLADLASSCGAVVAANVTRADWPDVINRSTPVVTWLTVGRIVPFSRVGPRDALLVADERWIRPAIAAGWPKQQVALAGWPADQDTGPAPAGAPLCLISDTCDVDGEKQQFELSSHRLLWDLIGQELLARPLVLGDDLSAYLAARMKRLEIRPEGFEHARFVEQLILPAYQQGLARMIAAANLPLRLHGRGWEDVDGLAACAAGPVGSKEDLLAAARQAAALIHAWPAAGFHEIETLARPVVRSQGRVEAGWLNECRRALKGQAQATKQQCPALSANAVEQMIVAEPSRL